MFVFLETISLKHEVKDKTVKQLINVQHTTPDHCWDVIFKIFVKQIMTHSTHFINGYIGFGKWTEHRLNVKWIRYH